MVHVGRGITQLFNDMEIDRIRGEWMMNATETIDESGYVKNRYQDLDGNIRSDVERGFSTNKHIVTKNRTLLSASSINGLWATWDAVKCIDSGSSHKVQIKPALVCAVQKSKSIYNQEQL
jgi:phage major head subunit gpT-like protein